MDGVAYLLSQKYKIGTLNERIPDGENRVEILVSEKSVSRREWMDAGRNGLNSEIELTTAAINYSGEREIEYKQIRYGIYRTFRPEGSDDIELYLNRKAGVQSG